MADEYNRFTEDDDFILASVLDESLRHYNEVEVPLQSINLNHPVDQPTCSVKKANSPEIVIDLCDSPKKCPPVQSRLSHFFRKSKSDEICESKINNEKVEQTDQFCVETNTQAILNDTIQSSNLPAIFHKEPDADGFHLSSGSHYVYPSNFPVREYQMTIIKTALFHNTLVSLPTGMGKTFIAAVVMYNFYRWYPMGKIIFMAPTRPLVAQQIEACHSITGISKEMTFEMTGSIPPEQRYLAWKKYRVFFLTPQVLANDLSLNKCPSDLIRCIIVDEAHRATKDYAYVQVLRHLNEEKRIFRIIGLSATPGTTTEAVCEVIQNLNISKLEFRTDESPDVAKYTNKKDVECIPVKLTNAILHIRTQFLGVYDKYSRRLKQYRALSGNVTNLTKFQILGAKQKFVTSNTAREMPKSLVGCLINDYSICMSLAYALELLTIYGIKVFYLQSLELMENHKCLSNDADLQKMLHDINRELKSQDLVWSHPKLIELKKLVQDYFGQETIESSSKIIIFCQYRLVVVEVFELLKTFGSSVKPVMFVGQSLKEKGGLPQKKQLEVMNRFKSGDFNVLIATSVAEEGLDIGEVDLIICLEANKSPIKFVQRLGRTGRKRSGKCVTLLTEGKEQMKYKSSVSSSKTLVVKMLKNNAILSKLSQGGPRLVPKYINPQRLMIHVKKPEELLLPEKKKSKGKKKEGENIIQYLGPSDGQIEEEEGPNVFQNNKVKPKRKTKKQKTVDLNTNNIDREVEPTLKINEDINPDYNPNENDYIHETHAPCIVENVPDRFVDEEEAFNEWVQSCKDTNTIITNDLFFKLLSLFTDDCSLNNNWSDNKPLKYNAKAELKNEKDDINISFRGKNTNDYNIMELNSSYAHKHSLESDNHLFHSSNNIQEMDYNEIVIDQTKIAEKSGSSEYVNGNVESSIDSCDLFVSQKLNKPLYGHNIDINTEQLSSKSSILMANKQKSPIICSNAYKMKTVKSAENSSPRKIDVDDSFKSQRANKCVEDHTRNVTDLILTDVSGDEQCYREELQRDDELVFKDDGLTNMSKTVEHDENNDDDDINLENVNFEDLFKSQRADTYIEKYNSKIIAEKLSDDSDDSFIMIDDELRNLEDGHKTQKATARHKSDDVGLLKTNALNEDLKIQNISTEDNSQNVVIDISDEDSTNSVPCKGKGSIDYGVLFKSQRANGYIEDYMEKVKKSPIEKNKTSIVKDDDDDDVICLSDSPDFLNRKLPKKTIQTKLTANRLTESSLNGLKSQCAPVCELVDLSSPPPPDRLQPADRVTDRSDNDDRGRVESNATIGNRSAALFDDDMDFMFEDYCSSGAFITQIERTAKDDDVFTQKPRATAKDDDVFTQKPLGELADPGGTLAVHRPGQQLSTVAAAPSPTPARASPAPAAKNVPSATTSRPRSSFDSGLPRSFNTLKACQLFKPGFSLKKGAAMTIPKTLRQLQPPPQPSPIASVEPKLPSVTAVRAASPASVVRARPEDDDSPLRVPLGYRRRALLSQFSQSTPKVASAAASGSQNVRRRPREDTEPAINVLLTSSSDSDVFVNDAVESTSHRCRVKKKRRPKPKKKLLFIDDEADVSYNCGETSMTSVTNRISSSDDEDEDGDDDLDSSFIDDDPEQSEQSTNMTKQYLQSVKSPVNARGIFKIPQLTRRHFNIDVYSQMDDRNENSYEEDSFCVRDSSDLNTSSNTSGHKTSEERPSKPQKRKRIMSPQSSDSDDSPEQFSRKKFRKRANVETSFEDFI